MFIDVIYIYILGESQRLTTMKEVFNGEFVTLCCSVSQCVAVCCTVWHCVAVRGSVSQCVALCCSVWQCVAA